MIRCVTQTADGVQQCREEHAGYDVHSGFIGNMLHNVKKIDGQVDTPDDTNLFHATAMAVYQRKRTKDSMTYLTEALHPESYLPPTIIIDGMVVGHTFIRPWKLRPM